MTTRSLALAILLCLGTACAMIPRSGVRSCPETWAPDPAAPDLTRRFRYRVENAAGTPFVADLVAERRAGDLVLVGFTPLGATAFALQWRGGEVTVEEHVRPLFPPPPGNALADLVRAGMLEPEAPLGERVVEACGYRATLRLVE